MEFYRLFSLFSMIFLPSGVKGHADNKPLNDRVDVLEHGVEILSKRFEFERQIMTEKVDLFSKQVQNILKSKTDLETKIRRYITESLSDILEDESVKRLIQSQVPSEVGHLKRANHHMKGELHQMRTSLEQIVEDNRVYRDGIQRGERQNTEMSQILVKSELLTSELSRHDRQIRKLDHKLRDTKDSCELSSKKIKNETKSLLDLSTILKSETLSNKLARHESQINELNLTLREQSDSCKSRNSTINKQPDSVLDARQTTSVSPPTTAAVPRATTTSKPSTEKSRIIVVPLDIRERLQLSQFNIITNSFDKYPHLSLNYYVSALYVSKINSLLISLDFPNRIIISELNTSKTETIKHNVYTLGMSADEDMGIVFLTTVLPTKSISRMSFHGENFTTLVNLSGYDMNPCALAINPTTKTIYAGNYFKLFKVFYDGTGLRTLDSGFGIKAVTLDITKGLLYYNKGEKLMKLSLSSEITSEVTRFNFYIWNLIFYQNKVYYSSMRKSPGVLGVVEHNNVSRTLQTVNVSGVTLYSICLIP